MASYLFIWLRKLSTLWDTVLTVVQRHHYFFYLKARNILYFWMKSTQHLSTLIAFQEYSQSFQVTFLKCFPKDFIQFLSECIVNLLRGELREFQKQEVLKLSEEIHLLILIKTSLSKRRHVLSFKKRISLLSILTPSILNCLPWNSSVYFDSSTTFWAKNQFITS